MSLDSHMQAVKPPFVWEPCFSPALQRVQVPASLFHGIAPRAFNYAKFSLGGLGAQ